MEFKNIILQNWKNFSRAEASLSQRCFLIGPNASGKSNFLDALKFLRDVSGEGLSEAVESRGGVSGVRYFAARKNNRIAIDVQIEDRRRGDWRYRLEFTQDNNRRPIIHEEVVEHGSFSLNRPNEPDLADKERLTQTALEQISENKEFRELSTFFKETTYLHLIPQVVRDPAGFSVSPVVEDPYGRDFLLRVWRTAKHIRESRLRKISSALQAAVPQLLELKAEMDPQTGQPHLVGTYSNWRPQGVRQLEAQFSDGTLRLIGLLWSVFEGKGTLLVEEPELSLHAGVVRHLPQLFYKINRSRSESRQIIISTHSEVLLSDSGITPEEVLWLEPTERGTDINQPDEADKKAMATGLTASDVLLPRTEPRGIDQLKLSF